MKQILNLVEQIRDEVNNRNLLSIYFGERADDWVAFCVAMDTVEDSGAALVDYEENGLGETDGEKYIRLYGLFQAVVLQQDAIGQMYQEFLGSEVELPDTSGWRELRDLRNLTAGQPLEFGGRGKRSTQRVFITRVTLDEGGFMFQVWDKVTGGVCLGGANLDRHYVEYKKQAIMALEKVLEKAKIV